MARKAWTAWAVLTEHGAPGSAWLSHTGALAESHGNPVVRCRIILDEPRPTEVPDA